jgi:hypothetical protein
MEAAAQRLAPPYPCARVEPAFARRETWKILRDCRLKETGVHHAMLGIAHLYNLERGA